MSKLRIIAVMGLLFPLLCLSAQGDDRDERDVSVLCRTNLLSDVVLTSPNIGVELQTKIGLALLVDYSVGFFVTDADFKYNSLHSIMAELRYYTRKQQGAKKGHHIGLYGQLGTYDFMFKDKGYQCKPFSDTYSIGFCYGYTLPLNKRFSIDFGLGLGIVHSRFDEYKPYNDLYIRTNTRSITKFLPTRAEISLVWQIY